MAFPQREITPVIMIEVSLYIVYPHTVTHSQTHLPFKVLGRLHTAAADAGVWLATLQKKKK
jgi:hypothetical protein